MSNSNITIVNVGYRSTNFWVVSAGRQRMLVDLGWPGTMGRFLSELKRKDIPLEEIGLGLATHYHIDHAGLGQDLKNAGMRLLVLDVQVEAIPIMKRWTKPHDNYTEILPEGNRVIGFGESRAVLAEAGVPGEVVHTPGHSDHCVSLLLDEGSVFTGDLTHPLAVTPEQAETVRASWQRLQARGARIVYPGHGPVYPLQG